MSRKRFITSEMSTDERLAEVAAEEPIAALIWPWILLELDDWGRAEFKPIKMKLSLFPACQLVSADCLAMSVDCLAKHGLLAKYEIDGRHFIAVHPKKWLRFQTYLVGTKRPGHTSSIPGNPAWYGGECHESWLLMTRQTERGNVSECQLTSADVSRCLPLSVPSPSPSLIKSKNTPLPPKGDEDTKPKRKRAPKDLGSYTPDFEKAWSTYPRKDGKRKAFEAWQKALTRDMPAENMPAHIESRSFEQDWRKDDGQFIPHMATWLNRDGWLDEGATITACRKDEEGDFWDVGFYHDAPDEMPKPGEVLP